MLNVSSNLTVSSGQIVDEASAILGVAGERRASINADHANLCKFSHAADNSLSIVIQYIKEFCEGIVPSKTALQPSGDPPHREVGDKSSLPSQPERIQEECVIFVFASVLRIIYV